MLQTQTLPAERIILINTEEKRYTGWASAERIGEQFPNLTVRHIGKDEFDHAGARNEGAAQSDAAFLLFMTMDAVPADEHLIRLLADVMERDEKCAVVYARQLPNPGATEAERSAREFNYPAQSSRKTLADEERLGIRASFASNVCAMYRRSVFDRLGGFSAPAIFNEDMVFAHAALHAGYSIQYCAEARVFHSHDYTAKDQFHRNFDLGVSQAMHPEVFGQVSSEREGKRFVLETLRRLFRTGHGKEIPGYLCVCAARYAGFLLGKNYRRLPAGVVRRCTNQREFWNRMTGGAGLRIRSMAEELR